MKDQEKEQVSRWPYNEIIANRTRCSHEFADGTLIQDRARLGAKLCLAIVRGDNREAEHLLNAGAPVNHQEQPDGWTPLIYSIYYNNPGGRQMLISHGADIFGTDFSGRTLLMFAALSGDKELTGELLNRGLRCETADRLGRTALDFAISGHCTDCIELLSQQKK